MTLRRFRLRRERKNWLAAKKWVCSGAVDLFFSRWFDFYVSIRRLGAKDEVGGEKGVTSIH